MVVACCRLLCVRQCSLFVASCLFSFAVYGLLLLDWRVWLFVGVVAIVRVVGCSMCVVLCSCLLRVLSVVRCVFCVVCCGALLLVVCQVLFVGGVSLCVVLFCCWLLIGVCCVLMLVAC